MKISLSLVGNILTVVIQGLWVMHDFSFNMYSFSYFPQFSVIKNAVLFPKKFNAQHQCYTPAFTFFSSGKIVKGKAGSPVMRFGLIHFTVHYMSS